MHRPAPGSDVIVATAGEPFQAFVPAPLPPEPPVVWSAALRRRFDAALVALGDAREVSRCVAALERGLKKLRGGRPLCTRLLCEMPKVLLTHPGGRGKTPGELRRSQVWIGGTRPGNAAFVPPPADAVPACLASLERFLNDDPEPVPPLTKAALVHVQFEDHPTVSRRQRMHRATPALAATGADGGLREPMLYPSLFFKTHRTLYCELLNEVRLRGRSMPAGGAGRARAASRWARRRSTCSSSRASRSPGASASWSPRRSTPERSATSVCTPSGCAAASPESLCWRMDIICTYLERDIPPLGPRIPAETLRR